MRETYQLPHLQLIIQSLVLIVAQIPRASFVHTFLLPKCQAPWLSVAPYFPFIRNSHVLAAGLRIQLLQDDFKLFISFFTDGQAINGLHQVQIGDNYSECSASPCIPPGNPLVLHTAITSGTSLGELQSTAILTKSEPVFFMYPTACSRAWTCSGPQRE